MKFLLVSEGGDGVGLAMRLKAEGNEVACWIRDDEASKRGDGLVDKVAEHNIVIDDKTVVLADCTGSGVLLDGLRRAGTVVVGGSQLADRLEANREFASEVMNECGINTPRSEHFDSYEEAEKAIENIDETAKIVFKPGGDLSGVVPSYVCHNTSELREVIKDAQSKHPKSAPDFTLQEFIEGVAVSTEAWFDGWDFAGGLFNHTIERKHLMNGDIGPSGGCTGNVVWSDGDSPLVRETVIKLKPFLREHQYIGPIDVNAVVTDDNVYGLEFTPRFGYDATPTLFWELFSSDIAAFLWKLGRGERPSETLRTGYGAGVRLSIPPWPSEKFHADEGLPITGLNRSRIEHFFPYDVMLSQEGDYCTSGGYGIIGVVTAHSQNLSEACEEATKLASKIKVPNAQYRTDLGEMFQKDYRKLKSYELVGA